MVGRCVSIFALAALLAAADVSARPPWLLDTLPAASKPPVNSKRPWFCHDTECPTYDVLNSTDRYETRQYDAAVWASTSVDNISYTLAVTIAFKRLFNYISGANEGNGLKIEMTTPVATQFVKIGDGPFCKSTFTTAFYMPQEVSDNPPEPSSPDVSVNHSPAGTVYVKQFGGYAEDFSVARNAKALADALEKEGILVDSEHYFVAGYDPPFRLTGRHNEIWMMPKSS